MFEWSSKDWTGISLVMSDRRGEIVREIWFLWGQKVATVGEAGKWAVGAGRACYTQVSPVQQRWPHSDPKSGGVLPQVTLKGRLPTLPLPASVLCSPLLT